MKIGINLVGISYSEQRRKRDWRLSLDNFKQYLGKDLSNQQISIYTTTYKHNLQESLLEDYQPKKFQFLDMSKFSQRTTYIESLKQLESEDLDLIISTRFDISFKKPILGEYFSKDKFNFCFREGVMWDSHRFVTDNLFVFPVKFLEPFKLSIEDLNVDTYLSQFGFMHHIYDKVVARIGEGAVNFLQQEQEESHNNTFYNLVRA